MMSKKVNSVRVFVAVLAMVFAFTSMGISQAAPPVKSFNGAPFMSYEDLSKGEVWLDGTHVLDDMVREHTEGVEWEALDTEDLRAKGKLGRSGAVLPDREGQEETFWSVALGGGGQQFVEVTATLRVVGENVYIYVENGQEVAEETLEKICKQIDEVIYPLNTSSFGFERKPGIDHDPRITLLLTDVQDGWEPGKGYVGGFYFPLNEYSKRVFPQSNEREMIYVDTYPSDPTSPFYLGVVAHEFQHMIHANHDMREDKWVNEGMSQLAFYICGYGHPSQVLAFIRNADERLDHFANIVDDYGSVYLWYYYIYTKYCPTPEIKQKFTRTLVDSPLKSVEGFNFAMKEIGVDKPFDEIFDEWAVANIINKPALGGGLYGYDDTLGMTVYHTENFATFPVEREKQEVQQYAADYIRCTPDIGWVPVRPMLMDKTTIFSDSPATVNWGVDGWQAPAAAIQPEGTVAADSGVESPMAGPDANGRYFVEIPPVAKAGKKIGAINFKLHFADGTFGPEQIIDIIGYDLKTAPAKTGRLVFDFQGDKKGWFGGEKKYKVLVIKRSGEDYEIDSVQLDDKNHGVYAVDGYGTVYDEVVFVPTARTKKVQKYGYKLHLEASKDQVNNQIVLLQKIQKSMDSAKGLGTGDEAAAAMERALDRAREATRTIVQRAAAAIDRKDYAEAAGIVKQVNEAGLRPDLTRPVIREVSEKLSNHLLGNASSADDQAVKGLRDALGGSSSGDGSSAIPERRQVESASRSNLMADPEAERGEDEDSSHTNWGYLSFKMGENLHALTHLKIDPAMLEGELMNMYKLLEVSLGLPHINFPDGLAIVDFDTSAADDLMAFWQSGEGTEKDKEALWRLYTATWMVENIYNVSLLMAEDTAISVYKMVELVLNARNITAQILNGLQDVPIVGNLAKKVKYRITAKLVQVIRRTAQFASTRIKAPYGPMLPMVTNAITGIYLWWNKIDLEHEGGGNKEMLVKVLGKYTLASLPRIGFVAVSQKYVDDAIARTEAMDFSGTQDEAWAAGIDDGVLELKTAALEKVYREVNEKHLIVDRDHQLSGITAAISQLSQYASLIDPTGIARIVAVVSGVASGGLLVHSTYVAGREYYTLPGHMGSGLDVIFHPGSAEEEEESEKSLVDLYPPSKHGTEVVGLQKAISRYGFRVTALQKAIEQDDRDKVISLFGEVMEDGERMDKHLLRLEARLSAAADPLSKSAGEKVYLESCGTLAKADMDECALYGDVVAYLAEPGNEELQLRAIESAKTSAGTSRLLGDTLFEAGLILSQINAATVVYPEVVRIPYEIKMGERKTVRVIVTNAGDGPAHDVVVRACPGGAIGLSGKDTVSLGTLTAGEMRELSWEITGRLREKLDEDDTIFSVMIETSNAMSGYDMRYVTVLRR